MIPANLLQRIDEVIEYIGNSTTDYLVVKRQLINAFPASQRALFSTRHPCTKKHQLNDFDHEVIEYWHHQTKTLLQIDSSKLHNPDWKQKKKGWALTLLNKQRKLSNEKRTTP